MDASFLKAKNTDLAVERATTLPAFADQSASSVKEQPARSRGGPSEFEKMVQDDSSNKSTKMSAPKDRELAERPEISSANRSANKAVVRSPDRDDRRAETAAERPDDRSNDRSNDPVSERSPREASKAAPKKEMRKQSSPTNETSIALLNLFGQDPSLSGTPILNFLTGKVDRLEPASIPQVVVSNDFIKNALSGADVNDFMTSVQPVQSLLNKLGIDAGVADQLQALGGNLNQDLSPQELLESMGVDSSRVLAELESLRDRLPIDGFQPYMARSAALRGNSQALAATARDAALSGGAAEIGPDNGDDDARMLMGASLGSAINSSGIPTIGGLAQSSNVGNRANSNSIPGASLARGSMAGSTAAASTNMPQAAMPELADMSVANQSASPTSTLDQVGFGQSKPASPMDVMRSLSEYGAKFAQSPISDSASGPIVKVVSTDPFEDLGRDLYAAELQATSTAETSPLSALVKVAEKPTSLSEVSALPKLEARDEFSSLRLSDSDLTGVLNASPSTVNQPKVLVNPFLNNASPTFTPPEVITGKDLAQKATETAIDSGVDSGVNSGAVGQSFQAFNLNSIAASLGKSQQTAMVSSPGSDSSVALADWLEGSRFAPVTTSAGSDLFGQGSSENSEERGFDADRGLTEALRGFGTRTADANSPRNEAVFGKALVHEAGQMTPADRHQLIQKITDNASMMLREGGSSIRIDLGTPELGKLNLAISINQDRVDVRIMTASDQVRDMLNRELPKLRDSMSLQNLNLGSVEVGVHGGQHNLSNSSSFNQSFNQNQGGRDAWDGNWNGSAMGRSFQSDLNSNISRDLGRRMPAPIQRMTEMPRVSEGRIQVRV